MSKPLLASEVAAKLRVSISRVRQLDADLQPEKTPGGVRVYREDAVDRVIEQRRRREGDRK